MSLHINLSNPLKLATIAVVTIVSLSVIIYATNPVYTRYKKRAAHDALVSKILEALPNGASTPEKCNDSIFAAQVVSNNWNGNSRFDIYKSLLGSRYIYSKKLCVGFYYSKLHSGEDSQMMESSIVDLSTQNNPIAQYTSSSDVGSLYINGILVASSTSIEVEKVFDDANVIIKSLN